MSPYSSQQTNFNNNQFLRKNMLSIGLKKTELFANPTIQTWNLLLAMRSCLDYNYYYT